jgi:peptidoglycan/xylan/chitin deacetylase (PgdA/CDA1 family)
MTRITLYNHVIERSLDLLLDHRLPHAALYTLWRLWQYTPLSSRPLLTGPLHICLTFDIEHDYRNPASTASSERFLPKYLKWTRTRGWTGTLYVQGGVVPALSELLQESKAEHELGLHGLYHEIWGRSRWWQYRLGLVGMSEAEKRDRLLQALDLFERAHLEPPRSFRAPYLNADWKTLKLLAHNGFTSDSSAPSYLGAIPVPRKLHGIWQVPVSANPRPEWNLHGARYHELSMGTMLNMSAEQIMATISIAVHLQQLHRTQMPPHLVLLAHPWEFEATPGVPHASDANWEHLDQIVNMIMAVYPAVFITMSGLIR